MNRVVRLRRSALWLAFVISLGAGSFLPCAAQPSAKIERHTRKIEKKISRFRAGALVAIDLRDGSEAEGTVGSLSDATFQITNVDSNKVQSFAYADVASVKKAKEYIGAGSERGHHIRLWVPVVVASVAVGGGIAAYEMTR